MNNKIDPKEVELFLLDNLDFFESRESLVSELKFKHSSSSASSLLERQIIKLRDEQKNLMDLLSSFIKTATLNEDLFNKSKELTLKILSSNSKKEIIEIGPGPGSLTRSILLQDAESVVAIEKDSRMINCLKDLKIICNEKLTLINNG